VVEQIQFAYENYDRRSKRARGILELLLQKYREEGLAMGRAAEELYQRILKGPPLKDRLQGVTAKEILQIVPHEDLLNEFSPEEIERHLRKTKAAKSKTRKPRK
jgi:hypothetical protein